MNFHRTKAQASIRDRTKRETIGSDKHRLGVIKVDFHAGQPFWYCIRNVYVLKEKLNGRCSF